jgi:gag-polypeptide of LTR copia-type
MAQRPITKVNVAMITELFHIGEKLNGNNWTIWREQMKHAFKMTRLAPYINGTLLAPSQLNQPTNFSNWEFNNDYARVLIIKNVDNNQLKHITKYNSAHDMWISLTMVHETQGFQTGLTLTHAFWTSSCSKDEDVEKHIDEVKDKWEHLNALETPEFTFSNTVFKGILIVSLPPSDVQGQAGLKSPGLGQA